MSCAHWVAWKLHLSRHSAREYVRVARALRELPLMQGAFLDGRLSYSKVRALTRIATPSEEEDLVNLGLHATASMIDRTVSAWRRCDAVDADPTGRAARRRDSWSYDESGMLLLTARLDAEEGAILLTALRHIEASRGEIARRTAEETSTAESDAGSATDAEASPRGLLTSPTPEARELTEAASEPGPSGPSASPIAQEASPRGRLDAPEPVGLQKLEYPHKQQPTL